CPSTASECAMRSYVGSGIRVGLLVISRSRNNGIQVGLLFLVDRQSVVKFDSYSLPHSSCNFWCSHGLTKKPNSHRSIFKKSRVWTEMTGLNFSAGELRSMS